MKFKLIKFQLSNGKWKNVFPKDEAQLVTLLNKYQPVNAFISIAQWMKPELVERHIGEKKLKAGFLNSEILVEIDSTSEMEAGLTQMQEAERFLFSPSINRINQLSPKLFLDKRVESGGGYYLIFKAIELPENRTERFNYIHRLRLELLWRLYKHFNNRKVSLIRFKYLVNHNMLKVNKTDRIDYKVCIDAFRVRRLDGTFNSKRNAWSKDMDKPTLYPYTPARMPMADDTTAKAASFRNDNQGRKPDAGKGTASIFPSTIQGVKGMAIPYFYFHRKPRMNIIKHYQEWYNINALYMFKSSIGFHVIGFDAIPKERLLKIYKAIKPDNQREFEYFQNVGIKWDTHWKFIWALVSRNENFRTISKSHYSFFRYLTLRHDNIYLFPDKRKKIGKTLKECKFKKEEVIKNVG